MPLSPMSMTMPTRRLYTPVGDGGAAKMQGGHRGASAFGSELLGHSVSVRASIEHRLVGLVLVGEIDGLILAQREVDVAHHLASARATALDVHREGRALAPL